MTASIKNSSQRWFIDASVLVEIIKNRFKKTECLDFLAELKGEISISILSISIVWHYTKPENIEIVREFLEQFEVTDLTNIELKMAYEIWQNEDLEDALQIVSCLNHGIHNLLTLDKKLALKYNKQLDIKLL